MESKLVLVSISNGKVVKAAPTFLQKFYKLIIVVWCTTSFRFENCPNLTYPVNSRDPIPNRSPKQIIEPICTLERRRTQKSEWLLFVTLETICHFQHISHIVLRICFPTGIRQTFRPKGHDFFVCITSHTHPEMIFRDIKALHANLGTERKTMFGLSTRISVDKINT